MQHTVLARKWRPKKFADLIGQQNSVKILTNIIIGNRLHHAYLLTGTRGVGKTTIARIIAKALNCLNPQDGEPCTLCKNCVAIDNGSFVDVIEIDAASNTGVDNIRELIDNAMYAPSSGKYKVYIIDEVHMLSKSAFNAMLKTLEEPPEHVIFILATTELQKVPATILSRCLQLKLRNITANEIASYLAKVLNTEQKQFEADALELIATAANGSMRDALSILDQAIAFCNGIISTTIVEEMLGLTSDEEIYKILDALISMDSKLLLQVIRSIQANGADPEKILLSLQQKLCDISLAQLGAETSSTELSKFVSQISINDVQLYFEITNLGIEQLQKVREKSPVFMMTMLRMLAFNIGSSEQKTIRLENSNFNVKIEVEQPVFVPKAVEAITSVTPVKPEPAVVVAVEEPVIVLAQESAVPPEPEEDISIRVKPVFKGNWIELIEKLKIQLGISLFPFVENAKLSRYDANSFDLIIDQRYEGSFSSQFKAQLEQVLSNYFMQAITIKAEFANNVGDTLKEKKILEKEQKQAEAEKSIHNDEYLAQVCSELSAKIVAGSIKPIS